MTGITWAEKPYSIKRIDATNISITIEANEQTIVLVMSDHEARMFAHDILKEAK